MILKEKNSQNHKKIVLCTLYIDAVSGWAGWALDHPEFDVSVNPIPNRGANYDYCITACQPGFENLTASLNQAFSSLDSIYNKNKKYLQISLPLHQTGQK